MLCATSRSCQEGAAHCLHVSACCWGGPGPGAAIPHHEVTTLAAATVDNFLQVTLGCHFPASVFLPLPQRQGSGPSVSSRVGTGGQRVVMWMCCTCNVRAGSPAPAEPSGRGSAVSASCTCSHSLWAPVHFHTPRQAQKMATCPLALTQQPGGECWGRISYGGGQLGYLLGSWAPVSGLESGRHPHCPQAKGPSETSVLTISSLAQACACRGSTTPRHKRDPLLCTEWAGLAGWPRVPCPMGRTNGGWHQIPRCHTPVPCPDTTLSSCTVRSAWDPSSRPPAQVPHSPIPHPPTQLYTPPAPPILLPPAPSEAPPLTWPSL